MNSVYLFFISSTGGMCKKGTFCPQGSTAPISCTPGYYCLEDKLPNVSGECGAGYYCNGSAIEQHPINETYGDWCPVGNYCPQKSPVPTPCNPGYFAKDRGNQHQNACIPCKVYFFFWFYSSGLWFENVYIQFMIN